jgi:hypothetical protein
MAILSMGPRTSPRLGIIEGFYGQPWPRSERLEVLSILARNDYGAYIYAPKQDRKLRRAWREPFSDDELAELTGIAQHCKANGLAFGIGLSPLGLTDIRQPREQGALRDKLEQIAALEPSLLGILFDDMPAHKNMADAQLAIIDRVGAQLDTTRLIVCPSYYSTDSVLEKIFGQRPEHYWATLGRNLDPSVDFFWTGEQVCSRQYSKQNLDFIAEQMRRLAVLWDNYPVNDGEKLSQYLHLQPFEHCKPWLRDYTAGHYANPMNQPWLSLLPLLTLPAVYNQAQFNRTVTNKQAYRQALQQVWQRALTRYAGDCSKQLMSDAQLFQTRGLNTLTDDEKQALIQRYSHYEVPMAVELCAWLRGEYAFAPACLTE